MSQSALRTTPPRGAQPAPWGCDWCSCRPAYRIVVTPAVYAGKQLVHRAVHAICCVPCAAYMKLDLAGARDNAQQVALRKSIAADKRADRRAAMKQAQQSLFT